MTPPGPWRQRSLRTTFLRVPYQDWAAVKIGAKTEFRNSGQGVTQAWNVKTPAPVVGFRSERGGLQPDARLLVLEKTWREALAALTQESLEAEGFPSMAHFRRYWMQRTRRRFAPLEEVQVYRVRPFHPDDVEPLALAMLEKLYGEHLPTT